MEEGMRERIKMRMRMDGAFCRVGEVVRYGIGL